VALTALSLLIYPLLCRKVALSPSLALSFPARSLTLALATPMTTNLGGNISLNAILAITSGMLGVLLGPTLLKWLRIPEDDYVTRGVTLGVNSSAIATALLLVTDPRAAAFASLSMGLFGVLAVGATSVPSVAEFIRGLAGVGG
jgi:putative effector of murein hydrolase